MGSARIGKLKLVQTALLIYALERVATRFPATRFGPTLLYQKINQTYKKLRWPHFPTFHSLFSCTSQQLNMSSPPRPPSQSRLFANPEALGPRPARQGVNTLLNMVLYIICLLFASKLTKLSGRSDLQVDELTIPHLFSLPLRWVAMALLQR